MSVGTVNIHGKEYKTVALRVNELREKHPEYCIKTKIQSNADVVLIKAFIEDKEGRVLATGYAEEVRDSTNINKTSAVENCETSAVGRALAFLGYGGTEIASANEVSDAIVAGVKKDMADYMAKYAACLRENIDTILAVQNGIALYETDPALLTECVDMWYDMSEEDQHLLYQLPTTKGGFLTTREREFMKTTQFKEARSI